MSANDENFADLEAFIIDNPDLERLEELLAQFNIFEVLGAVRQEVRHSDFLSYLMNPQETHGLGDYFIRKFLQAVIRQAETQDIPITGIDLAIWDLTSFQVRREWQSIDILLTSEELGLVIIIENKVVSAEHSNQLQRYYKIATSEFPGWKILGVFLTPEGDSPTDDRYLPISYQEVCEIIEAIVETRGPALGPDVLTLMKHYTKMLRRHVVSGSEMEHLCQRIYRKHQKALDLIYEYRPDLQSEIHEFIKGLISEEKQVHLDSSTKSYIRFFPDAWLKSPALHQGEGWSSTNRILLFEIQNFPDALRIGLIIGPGENQVREKLYDMVKKNLELFQPSRRQLTSMYLSIYRASLLTKRDFSDVVSIDDIKQKIKAKWDHFIENQLPELLSVVNEQEWIWDEFPWPDTE